jgi:hypothetical protein
MCSRRIWRDRSGVPDQTEHRCRCIAWWPNHEGFHRLRDVLQVQGSQCLEWQIKPAATPIMNRSGNADRPGWADLLQPDCNDDAVAVKVPAIGDDIAEVDTEAHSSVIRPTLILAGEFTLDT